MLVTNTPLSFAFVLEGTYIMALAKAQNTTKMAKIISELTVYVSLLVMSHAIISVRFVQIFHIDNLAGVAGNALRMLIAAQFYDYSTRSERSI